MPTSASGSAGRQFAGLFTARLATHAAGLLTQSLLAYLLLPAGRGAYAVCVTFAYLVSVGLTLSAEMGAQFFSIRNRAEVPQNLTAALGVCLVGSALAVALALPFMRSGLAFFSKAEAGALQLSLLLIPLVSCSYTVELQLAGLKRFGPLAMLLLCQSAIVVLLTLVLVWRLEMGVGGAVLALAAGHALLLAAGLADLRRNAGFRVRMPCAAEFRRILGYGARYHPTRLGNELEPRIGVLFLGMLASQADIGLFATMSMLMLRFNLIPVSASAVLYPRAAAGEAMPPHRVGLYLRLVCLATGAALALLVAFGEPLVRLLFSAAFVPAVPLLWVMAPGILAYAAAGLFATYFNGVNQPGVCSWAAWLGLSVNAATLLALHPILGMAGAAWALTAGLAVRAALLALLFHRQTGIGLLPMCLPRRSDLDYLLALLRSSLLRR